MSYAFVQDVAASWEQYKRVAGVLAEPAPEGLVLHVAGPTDEGFRIIAVWESQDAWQRFRGERLLPAVAALGGPARPEPTFRDLQAAHVVVGEGSATWIPADSVPAREGEPVAKRRRGHRSATTTTVEVPYRPDDQQKAHSQEER